MSKRGKGGRAVQRTGGRAERRGGGTKSRRKTPARSRPRLAPAAERIPAIIERLYQRFPEATCALDHQDPLQLLVATILSAQCTDARVNIVTGDLFTKYHSAEDYAAADPSTFEKEIQSTGFFRNKTKSILGMAQALVERHGGRVPDTMEELTGLPGVGRKTANVILGTAFGKNEGVVVVTHLARIAARLAITKQSDPVKIEHDLMNVVPREEWTQFAHTLIHHGRAICVARKPRCEICPITDLCPSSEV
ncbi:MAG: endonuclease III [Gemmatimonadetes bacterium]|nr:endonuclease III [Gemmatimonadota bacterium]